MFRRCPLLLAGKAPEAVTRMAHMDVAPGTDAHPCSTGRIVGAVHSDRWTEQRPSGEIFQQGEPRQMGRMQPFRRLRPAPVEPRKYPGRIGNRLQLTFYIGHDVFIEVKQRLHVKTTLHRIGNAKLPAKMHQADSAFHSQPCIFKALAALPERIPRSNGVIYQNYRLKGIDFTLNDPHSPMRFGFLADEQSAIASARLQNAGLENGNANQSVSGKLPAVEAFQ